jgi:hypothetical protein
MQESKTQYGYQFTSGKYDWGDDEGDLNVEDAKGESEYVNSFTEDEIDIAMLKKHARINNLKVVSRVVVYGLPETFYTPTPEEPMTIGAIVETKYSHFKFIRTEHPTKPWLRINNYNQHQNTTQMDWENMHHPLVIVSEG